MTRRIPFLLGLMLLAAFTGCEPTEPTVYRVAKESHDQPTLDLPAPRRAALTWLVPETWKEAPVRSMLIAVYTAPDPAGEAADAEFTVSALGGGAGGELANVNRWRGQLQLPPTTQEVLTAALREVETAVGPAQLVTIEGAEEATLAAWLSHAGRTWFFKFSGPSTSVLGQVATFERVVASMQASPDGGEK